MMERGFEGFNAGEKRGDGSMVDDLGKFLLTKALLTFGDWGVEIGNAIEISGYEDLGTENSAEIGQIEGFEKQELEEEGQRETAAAERGGGFESRESRNRHRSNRWGEDGSGGDGFDEDSDERPYNSTNMIRKMSSRLHLIT